MLFYIELTLIIVILLTAHFTMAQVFGNDEPIQLENLQPESEWQIIEQALLENNFKVASFKSIEGQLMSDWITWTSMMIKNRARLNFTKEGATITLRIADRSYNTKNTWSEAIGNLSKKKYQEYVETVANRINEINNNPALKLEAIKASKLIPAFNAVFAVDELVFKLMKTSKDENQHLTLEYTVHNKAQKEVKVDIPLIGFKKTVNSKVTGARGNVIWSRPAEMGRNAVIHPDETLSLTFENPDKWELNTLPQFDIRVICNGSGTNGMRTMSIYSIPIPYVYQEGD